MAIDRRQVHFREGDPLEVIGEIETIEADPDAGAWVTFSPWVDPEDIPVVSVLKKLFSARGSQVPEITWVPARNGEPAQVGILHSTGGNALERLGERGVHIPDEWKAVSDHTLRGLLLAMPPGTSARRLVRFCVESARALAAVPTDDRFIAEVSTPG